MSAAQTVMIACKAPGGVVLNLDRYEKIDDKGNVRRIPGNGEVTLKGWSRQWGVADDTVGGYGMTEVNKDFIDEWLARNPDSSLVKDKIILMPHKDATGQAVGHTGVKKMFAPVDINDFSGIKKLEND